jgi:hypothetical protein
VELVELKVDRMEGGGEVWKWKGLMGEDKDNGRRKGW